MSNRLTGLDFSGAIPILRMAMERSVHAIGRADVVLANGAHNLLPILATLVAHVRRRKVIFVLHGSGAPLTTSSFRYHRVLRVVFDRLIVRRTLRRSHPISLSQAGIPGARKRITNGRSGVSLRSRHVPG